jgi:hypothetical protein
MEHEVPQKLLVRLLFYVRLLSMGLRKALAVLGNEDTLFRRHFHEVERIATDTGRSKIILGRGPRNASHDVSSVPGEVVLPGAKVSARGR